MHLTVDTYMCIHDNLEHVSKCYKIPHATNIEQQCTESSGYKSFNPCKQFDNMLTYTGYLADSRSSPVVTNIFVQMTSIRLAPASFVR